MKTQIIQLETHDDVISVRDRMSWAKTPRILLVWPRRAEVDLRPLDLVLLQRQAALLGAQLGLVTRRDEIRQEALELGIPVFQSAGAAQREVWPAERPLNWWKHRRGPSPNLRELQKQAHRPEANWRSHPATRIGFFTLGVLAILTLLAFFIPSAVIEVLPLSQRQSVVLPVTASLSVDKVYITGSLPASQIQKDIVGTQSRIAFGAVSVPQDKAVGEVQFRNLTEQPQRIPAGTVVSTTGVNPVRFVTTQAGELAAGVDQRVNIAVEAMEGGREGNLPADHLRVVEGSLGLAVDVTNLQPTEGGTEVGLRGPSDEDRQQLHDDLLQELQDGALEKMESALKPGDLLFPDTIEVKVLDETFDPPEGQPGSRLELTMQVEISARYAAASDLTELAQSAVNASMPQGYVPEPDSLRYNAVADPVTSSDGITRWRMQVEQRAVAPLDKFRVVTLAQGRSPAAAVANLDQALDLKTSPQIKLSPPWWPWLPLTPFRVTVNVQ